MHTPTPRPLRLRTISAGTLAALLAALAGGPILPAHAVARSVVVPQDTVLRLRLDQPLGSEDARVGDTFASVLDSDDRSGFPAGSRFQGVVTEVRRHTKTQPAVLNVEIRRAFLPDGGKVALQGRLASLEEKDVRRAANGRLESRKEGKPDWKWAGYGAAGGLVLSAILGGDALKGILLGGLGGGAYSYVNRNKNAKFREVSLDRDTEFGARLLRQVTFRDNPAFRHGSSYVASHTPERDRRAERRDNPRDGAVLGSRQETSTNGKGLTVRLNGQRMSFGSDAPRTIEGTPFVPLERIATATGMRLRFQRGEETFELETPDGNAEGRLGSSQVSIGESQTLELRDEPLTLNGALFVTPEFLRRVALMRVEWRSDTRELSVETDR